MLMKMRYVFFYRYVGKRENGLFKNMHKFEYINNKSTSRKSSSNLINHLLKCNFHEDRNVCALFTAVGCSINFM